MEQIRTSLPRLLALFDTNPLSVTYGVGDRYRWAWKLIDFGNGTFQGAAHGLARLLAAGLLPPEISEPSARARIDAAFRGAATLTRPNGSLEEALPYESSFCVTALVAYDLLSAVELLTDGLEARKRAAWVDVVRPMIGFLHRADERHAFISNHLATAAAALYKWTILTGEQGDSRGAVFLNRILAEQSGEGWFREYDGADPGYQTLCTYYLADLHRMRPDLELREPLRRSVAFLAYFAHPDGSFGGLYGSRNTRFYYPAGIEYLAPEIPEAAALAQQMRRAVGAHRTVTLDSMDEPNLVPMFSAYAWAAALMASGPEAFGEVVPALDRQTWRREFSEAGLLVDSGADHYTVVSMGKGGVCYHFDRRDGSLRLDAGAVVTDAAGRHLTTQATSPQAVIELVGDRLTVTTPLNILTQRFPSPFEFAVLRVLSLSVMRSARLGDLIKRGLVKLLITGTRSIHVRNRRTIRLGADLQIEDQLEGGDTSGWKYVPVPGPFSAIHMASQGYWQMQDDQT